MNSTTSLGHVNIQENRGGTTLHPGILAITTEQGNGITTVVLEIACQPSVYKATLSNNDLPQAKFLPDATSPLEFLKNQLSRQEPTNDSPFQTKYEYTKDGTIRIHISQRLVSGLVRVIWQSTLKNDSNSLFQFTEHLFRLHQDSQTSRQHLQKDFLKLEQARDDWKDTAEKLEHVWENEKSELLENFLILYKKQQEMTAEAKERVQQLEEMLKGKEQELANVISNAKKSKQNKMMANMLNDEPDDLDNELFPNELVDRLAGTKSNDDNNSKKGRGQKRPASTTTVVPKKIRNKATGAIEYFDEDEALADLVAAEDGTSANKKKNGVHELERKNSQKPAAREELLKKTGRKSKKDDSSTDSAGDYSYSELDSSILAQLAAMKDMDKE